MGRKLYGWHFKQKVNKTELSDGFTEVRGYTEDFIADHLANGFSAAPILTQASPSPDFTVDVNIPGSGGIVGYNKYGVRIGIPGTLNVDFGTVTGGPVTLPAVGNEQYVTLLVDWTQFASDSRTDGYGDLVDYVLEDGHEFSVVMGTEALAGAAVRPAHPGDSRMVIGSVLLTNGMTTIVNADIDQYEMRRLTLNEEILGTQSSDFWMNANKTGDPTANEAYTLFVSRGDREDGALRWLEGGDPTTDAPVLQVKKFSDTDAFVWAEVASALEAAGWTKESGFTRLTTITDSVAVGVATPDASAKHEVSSTTKGVLVPRVTTVQRTAIPAPATGLYLYNTDLNEFEYFNGATWSSFGTGGGSGGDVRVTDPVVLSAGNISDGYYDLVFTPSDPDNVVVHVVGVSTQFPGTDPLDDFQMLTNGSSVKRVSWAGQEMANAVIAGTKVIFEYAVGNPVALPIAAANVSLDTSLFNNNLSVADDTVQKAMNTLDDLIAGGGTGTIGSDFITVNALDIANGYVVLSNSPPSVTDVIVFKNGGSVQEPVVDYTLSGGQLSWTANFAVAENDRLVVLYPDSVVTTNLAAGISVVDTAYSGILDGLAPANVQIMLDAVDSISSSVIPVPGASYTGNLSTLTASSKQEDVNALVDGLSLVPNYLSESSRFFEFDQPQREFIIYTGNPAVFIASPHTYQGSDAFGVVSWETVPGNTGRFQYSSPAYLDTRHLDFTFRVKLKSTGVLYPVFYLGFIGDGVPADPTSVIGEIGFQFDQTNWHVKVTESSVPIHSDTNVLVGDTNWHTFRMTWNATTELANFYVDGVLLAGSTNVDLSALTLNQLRHIGISAVHPIGSADADVMQIDYLSVTSDLSNITR